jgi:hypothetical protein
MSAPVKGRLVGPVETGVTFAGVGSRGRLAGATPWAPPEAFGGTTQPGWVIEPADAQPAAPAAPDSIVNDATAKPEPMINRLAHMMFAPSSRWGFTPAIPRFRASHDCDLRPRPDHLDGSKRAYAITNYSEPFDYHDQCWAAHGG